MPTGKYIRKDGHKEAISVALKAFHEAHKQPKEVIEQSRKDANRRYRSGFKQMNIFMEPDYHQKLQEISKKMGFKSLHSFSKFIMHEIVDNNE